MTQLNRFLLQAAAACLALALSLPAQAAVVLLYHHVSERTPAATSVTPAQFAEHLQKLADEGFQVVRLDELVERVRAGEPAQSRLAAITFDDAYRSILENALPLLKQQGWPATVFVATEAVGQGGNIMSADDLRALEREGWLLTNHGHQHLHMVRRQPDESERAWLARLREDITQAEELLAQWLEKAPPKFFAYPYGEHDAKVRELLRELGYIGFAQRSGAVGAQVDWQNVPRIPVNRHYAGWDSLGDKVRALPMPVQQVSPASGITTDKRPALTLVLPADWAQRNVNCFAGGAAGIVREVHSDGVQLRVTPGRDLTPGRTLVNCTASAGQGRFYWYSWLWMHRGESWYSE